MMRTVFLLCTLGALVLTFRPVEAATLWYDFEGDSGAAVVDKLTGDGAQNGTILGNVGFSSAGDAIFGTQSGVFTATSPPYSTIEIPGTSTLGDSFSVALHAAMIGSNHQRLFSGFRGVSGAVQPGELVFDYLASGKLRAIYNGTTLESPAIGAIGGAGYQHFALTVDNGSMGIYHNGLQIASGTVALGATMVRNIHVGEDPSVVIGLAPSEQLAGLIVVVVVIDRALLSSEISALASGQSALTAVNPAGSTLAVNYRFEGSGAPYSDSFTSDGSQDGIARQRVSVSSDSPREGSGSALLEVPAIHSKIATPITGTDLGDQFTLSAVFNMPQGGNANGTLARIFSTYGGSGSTVGRLLLDVNPAANVSNIGVRLVLPNGATIISADPFTLNENHTVTATFDQGEVRLYLDGVAIGSTSDFDPLTLGAHLLHIGEDLGGVANDNFVGRMDDVLILDRALSAAEVQQLHQLGYEQFQAIPEPAALVFAAIGTALLGLRRRAS